MRAVKKFSRPKALESIDKKLDALLESSQQHQDSLNDTETKVDNATLATTLATENIIKLSKELSARLPSIKKSPTEWYQRSALSKVQWKRWHQPMPQLHRQEPLMRLLKMQQKSEM